MAAILNAKMAKITEGCDIITTNVHIKFKAKWRERHSTCIPATTCRTYNDYVQYIFVDNEEGMLPWWHICIRWILNLNEEWNNLTECGPSRVNVIFGWYRKTELNCIVSIPSLIYSSQSLALLMSIRLQQTRVCDTQYDLSPQLSKHSDINFVQTALPDGCQLSAIIVATYSRRLLTVISNPQSVIKKTHLLQVWTVSSVLASITMETLHNDWFICYFIEAYILLNSKHIVC